MDLGAAGTEHVAGTTPPRAVFAAVAADRHDVNRAVTIRKDRG
jgi:hypothetical protein